MVQLQPGTLSIGGVNLSEGNSGGPTVFSFVVTRSGGTDGAVSATWTLNAPGGASFADGSDFDGAQAMTGIVSFADGVDTATIDILVNRDTDFEDDEDFTVTLAEPLTGGVTITGGSGLGTIVNDDPDPRPIIDLNGPDGGGFGYTTTYNEDDTAGVAIGDADLTISDDLDTVHSVTIEITDGRPGDELFSDVDLAATFSLIGTWSAGTRTFTITALGGDFDHVFAQALTHIRFRHDGNDPTAGGGAPTRSISVIANDGSQDGPAAFTQVTINASPDAPTIDLDGPGGTADYATAYTEGGPAVRITDTDVEIVSTEGGITEVTVTITDFAAGDTFSIDVTGPIHGDISYNFLTPGVARVINSGSATAADMELALTYLRYSHAGNNPTAGGSNTDRNFTFLVTDAGGTSNIATTVIAVAEAPPPTIDLDDVAGGANYAGSYTENGAGAPIGSNINITAAGPTIDSAIVSLTDGQVGDELIFTGPLPSGISLIASAGLLQFIGNATIAEYEAVLAAVRYRNTTDDPTLNGNTDRVITVYVNDNSVSANSNVATATITVVPENDIAMLSGDTTGSATENSNTVAEGTITAVDADTNQSRVAAQIGTTGTYGSFTIAENGEWSYAPNDNNFLRGGQQVTDTFTVTSFDGSATINVVITITGLNDVPSVFSFGNTASRSEDGGNYVADGGGSMTDPDTGESTWQTGTFATTYGSITISSPTNPTVAEWNYTMDNAGAAVQGLRGGQVVVDTFNMLTFDGSNFIPILITITGVNDNALIGGTNTGSVAEDGTLVASGTLTIADPDSGENELVPQNVLGSNGYGTFVVNADGSWTYTLSNGLMAVQALNTGQMVQDFITVASEDGTDTENITITISGADEPPNQAPVIDFFDNVTFVEDNPLTHSPIVLDEPGAPSTISDPDSADFAGGTLTLSITSGGIPAQDILTVRQTGPVTLSGNDVVVNGTTIGTWAGGTNGTDFVVTFNAMATVARVQVLMSQLAYDNSSQEPNTQRRFYSLVITDGDGGTSNTGSGYIDLYATNDAPTGADNVIGISEDGTRVLTAADFGFSDVDGDSLLAVLITTLPTTGALLLNGAAVTAGQAVSVADINAGLLRFVAAHDASGTAAASFQFQVRDNGGTENNSGVAVPNHGVDTDQSPHAITFNIAGIADGANIRLDAGGPHRTVGTFNMFGGVDDPRIDIANADEDRPRTAATDDGGWVMVWTQSTGTANVLAQRFFDDGSLNGGTITITPAAGPAETQPDVASLAGGGFAVAYVANGGGQITVAIYGATGTVPTSTVILPDTGLEQTPTITRLSDGSLLVTWEVPGGGGTTISGVRVGANGVLIDATPQTIAAGADNFHANNNPTPHAVTALGGGNFALAWVQGGDVRVAVGTPGATWTIGAAVILNEGNANDRSPTITLLSDGRFLVVWEASDGGPSDLYGQFFSAAGAAVGGPVVLTAAIPSSEFEPNVSALADGGFAVTWLGNNGPNNTGDVRLQTFNADGSLRGGVLNVTSTGFTPHPNGQPIAENDATLTTLSDGRIVLWDPLESTCRHASLSIL